MLAVITVGPARRPVYLQRLIAAVARINPTWGGERIAAELLLKLGLRVSPRTVRRSRARGRCGGGAGAAGQRWATFVRNHAHALLACDCCVAVIATFRLLSICVALPVRRRWRVPVNIPSHPTAAWTLPPFRENLAAPHAYQVVLHARDRIYVPGLDATVDARVVRGLRPPVQAPQANAYCERRLGSLRWECLDFLTPLSEDHLRRILDAWRLHYNRGRPPASLGPGLPVPPPGRPAFLMMGHQLPRDVRVVGRPILGGSIMSTAWKSW